MDFRQIPIELLELIERQDEKIDIFEKKQGNYRYLIIQIEGNILSLGLLDAIKKLVNVESVEFVEQDINGYYILYIGKPERILN